MKKTPLLKMLCLMLCLIFLIGCSPEDTSTSQNRTKGEEIKMKDFGDIKIGDTVSFGNLKKDDKADSEKEEINWLVLAVEGKKALLITAEGIDCQQYHEKALATDWERCSLRKWLNETFFNAAFTAEEAAQIAEAKISWEENPSYSHKPAKDAEDRLFLLSISEAEKYFSSDDERRIKPSSLAVLHGVYADESTGSSPWWLRNQGSAEECASLVDEFGAIDHSGDGVYCEGNAVRPAMWIQLI